MPFPVVPEPLTELAGAWMGGLLDASLRGTVLLLGALVAARLLRRRPAAMRHLVWAAALVGLLLLPVLSGVLPPVEVPGMPGMPDLSARPGTEAAPAGSVSGAEAPSPSGAEGTPVPGAAAPADAPRASARSPWARSWPDGVPLAPALGAVWLLGVLVVLARSAAGRVRVAWLARSATAIRDGPRARIRDRLARRLGLRREVRLLAGSTSSVPMTWGLARPRILLPRGSAGWPRDCLRNVLLHELAHVRRGDYALRLVGRIAAAAYWFHPLVWLALRRMRREQEQACDDHVLRAGVRPSEYAGQLVRLARRLRPAGHGVGVGTSGGGPSEFSLRMRSLLRADRPRGRVRRGRLATAGGLATLVVAGLAVLAPGAERDAPDRVGARGAAAPVALPSGPAPAADPGRADAASARPERAPDAGPAPAVEDGPDRRSGPAPAGEEPDDGPGAPDREAADADDVRPTPAPSFAGDPWPADADPFLRGGGPLGWTPPTLGRPSPFERAARAAGPRLDLSAIPRPGPSPAGPGLAAGGRGAACPEDCTVEGVLRRLAERPDSSGRMDLLRRLAEDPSGRSGAVLMDVTYRASRASDRRLAVQALADVQGAVGDRYLYQVARANPWVSVRAAAIDELARSDGDEVVPWLVNLAYHDVSPEVQKFTVSVLARLDRSGAGSGLLQIARSHPEERVRDEAVYWLVRTGREHVLARLIGSA